MRGTILSGVTLLVLICANAGRAQDVQVPLDSSGQVEVLDAPTAQRLEIFGEYPGFEEARLFQSSDSNFVLEITYRQDDKLLKERRPLTSAEVTQLRLDMSRRMRLKMPSAGLNQEGRAKLLVGTTLLGLFYYGWAMPAALDVQDAKAIGAMYMLTSGASYLVPYLISRNTSITDPEAGAALYGGTRGILHGFALYGLIADDEGTGQAAIATSMMTSVGELIGGFQAAKRHRWSAGRVSTMSACSDYGMVVGAATGLLATDGVSDDNQRTRPVCAALLAGAVGGAILGNTLTHRQEYTTGDAYVLRETGLLGLGVTMTIADVADANDAGFEIAAIAGPTLGVLVGHRLTRPVNFTPSQGTLIGLSELGGALIGFGVAYLADAKESSGYLALGTVGATVGFGLAYHSFSHSAHAQPRHSLWDLRVSPQSLMTYDRAGAPRAVPAMNVRFQF